MVIRLSPDGITKVKKVTSDNTTIVKKVTVGTPVRRVSSGAFDIDAIGGIVTQGAETGSVLVYDGDTDQWVARKTLTDTNITGGQF
jgi:hypothetical protein